MLTSRLAASLTAGLAGAALALPAAAATPSATGAGRTGAAGATELVLLTLKPHDRGALRQLAAGHAHHGAAATVALQHALPSVAERQSVVASLHDLGLTVRRASTMAVLASGPADLVNGLFGSARRIDPHSRVQHPLPKLPSALRGDVTVAFGGDDNRPAFTHFAQTDPATGTDFRSAYGVTGSDPTQLPASSAAAAATKAETIATVQLSGWNSSDLSHYADDLRANSTSVWPDPKYSEVRDPMLPPHLSKSGQVEVDLDQEAIYSINPYANQRAYLSGNDLLGMYDSLSSIGDDASDPTRDRHIVAASISWGFCESDLVGDPSASGLFQAFEDVLSYDLATGVTVFAASGDEGGFCDPGDPSANPPVPPKQGVTYPASSPQVVAVGGTSVLSGQSASDPTQATGWRDTTANDDPTTWSPGQTDSGASGGGESQVFARPAYAPAAETGSAWRTVPDVSAVAGDPGFVVYSSSTTVGASHLALVGGTSLASPVTAADFATQVAAHKYSWGVGNILPGLYAQQNYSGAGQTFTDIVDPSCTVTGSGCQSWNGVDIARPGYDEVTGLGTPLWSALLSSGKLGGDPHLSVGLAYSNHLTVPVTAHIPDWQAGDYNAFRIDVDGSHDCTVNDAKPSPPTSVHIDDGGFSGLADGVHDLTLVAFKEPDDANPGAPVTCHYADAFVFIDTTKPVPTATLAPGSTGSSLTASWGGHDPFGGSGIKEWRIRVTSGGRTVYSNVKKRPGHVTLTATRGHTYVLSVTAVDQATNARTTTARLVDDRQFGSFSSGWSRVSARTAYEGTLSTATRRGASAVVSASGRSYVVFVTTCASCGKLGVYVGGKLKKTVDTYSSRTRDRRGFLVFTSPSGGSHRIVVKAMGTRNRHSSGTRVLLDALAADA